MYFRKRPAFLAGLLLLLAIMAPVSAQIATNDDTTLKQFIIFGRHSIRAGQVTPGPEPFASKPYPAFEVQSGYLTPNGALAEGLLASYYHDYLIHEGLLTGNPQADLANSYFRANSIQRSNITAEVLGAGLIPGIKVPVHSYPLLQPDGVFDPIVTNVAAVDANRAAKEIQALYNSGTAIASGYSGEFSLVRSVLFNYSLGTDPPPSTPSGLTDPTTSAIPLTPVTSGLSTGYVVNVGGLQNTVGAADPFVMEYADGMPLKAVGWGQLSPDTLSQQTRLITLEFNIVMRAPYVNRVQSSNAAAHVLRSMKQAVIDEAIPGSFSDQKPHILGIISSDAYVLGLAGMLDLHWQLPGYQPDFCPPGGALVFELRQSRRTGEYLVRVYFTAQTFDQLRSLTPLSLNTPPATMQLRIPGGGNLGGNFDVKFETFQKLLNDAIGWKYVQDPRTEVPPGVLDNVPLK